MAILRSDRPGLHLGCHLGARSERSGQVAQSVEQGTENPRVGGSTPSLATLLFLSLVPAIAACASDPCTTLCTDVSRGLDECLPSWGFTWEGVGADSRSEWVGACQGEWDEVRSSLEARELPPAEQQCTDARAELDRLRAAEDGACDELRVLYLD